MSMFSNPSRRSFLLTSAAAIAGAGLLARYSGVFAAETIMGKSGKVSIQRFTDLGKSIDDGADNGRELPIECGRHARLALAEYMPQRLGRFVMIAPPNRGSHADSTAQARRRRTAQRRGPDDDLATRKRPAQKPPPGPPRGPVRSPSWRDRPYGRGLTAGCETTRPRPRPMMQRTASPASV